MYLHIHVTPEVCGERHSRVKLLLAILWEKDGMWQAKASLGAFKLERMKHFKERGSMRPFSR
jgi:hypothetical protein